MSEGVVMFDEKGELVVINATARDMLGYHQTELNTASLLNFFEK